MSLNSSTIGVTSSLTYTVPAGGTVFNAYNVAAPLNILTTYTAGTGPNQVAKFAMVSGTTTISTLVTIDLSTVVCVDNSTGFSHVRELIEVNLDGTNVIKHDSTVTNSFLGSQEAAGKIDIQPGAPRRDAKPLGTNGYVVDGTHKIVTLDPGAFAIPYMVLIAGD